MIKIPRYTGREIGGEAKTELDHYANCPVCGVLVDLRDLAAVMHHAHGQEIEIEEAPDDRLH